AQEWMSRAMAAAGLDVDVWEIDLERLSRHPSYHAEIERDRALGVVGTRTGSGDQGRSLILNGHVDVVPPGDRALWTHEPFGGAVVAGRIFGRGALDMKGPLLAGLYALKALEDAGVDLAGTVHLESVVGEEDGGLGTLAALERGYRADGAVVMEPTEECVAPSQAGALNFRVRVPGLAAHGAVRNEGVSAIENFIPVYRALQDLERRRNEALGDDPLFATYAVPFAICVGTIEGGDWASSVPDHLSFEGRFGVAPGESVAEACRSLEEAVAAAARKDPWLRDHPPEVEWWGGRFDPARTSPDHPLVRSMVAASELVAGDAGESTGTAAGEASIRSGSAASGGGASGPPHGAKPAQPPRPPGLRGMTYGADMGLLVNQGKIPTVLYGPGDIRRAHRPDEYVEVDALVRAARTLAVGMMRFCGVR
ncbi:MAG: ArgE/DapE family deacylase, partial [Gemmatimonadota bacterium]